MAVEVEQVFGDLRPGAVMNIHAIARGMLREGIRVAVVLLRRFMLIVMDVVVQDADLLRSADSVARTVRRRLLAWAMTAIIENAYRRAAPAGDLHIGYFDVEASKYEDAELIDGLLPTARTLDSEA